MKYRNDLVMVWLCFVGLIVELDMETFEDLALIWLKSTIPVGRPIGRLVGRLLEELGIIPTFSPSAGFELGFGLSLAIIAFLHNFDCQIKFDSTRPYLKCQPDSFLFVRYTKTCIYS